MWGLTRPSIDPAAIYEACTRSIRRPDRRRRLALLERAVLDAALKYEEAAARSELHSLTDLKDPDKTSGVDLQGQDDLRKVYTDGLVTNQSGRIFYDAILNSVPHGRCPFCRERRVSTLDHQLPKSSYALLAITPDNLVPACTDCNHRKGDAAPTSTETQTIHPYFEHADTGRWLFASVAAGDPFVVTFYAAPDATFTKVMRSRICRQFDHFGLARLYSAHAAGHLTGERDAVELLRRAGGSALVESFLGEAAAGWKSTSPNCWQYAMYEALAEFIHGPPVPAAPDQRS